jgi:hypothetical protein
MATINEQAKYVAEQSDEDLFRRGFEMIAAMPHAVEAAIEDIKREWGLELEPRLVGGLLACGASLVFMTGKQAALKHLKDQEGKDS